MFVIFITGLYGFQYKGPDCTEAPLKMWMYVELGYYAFNFLFSYCYYLDVKRNNRENIKFMGFNCLLNLVNSGWLIYGNVIFWKHRAACQE